METIFARCAGLDVHKAQVTACVRVPDAAGGREQQLAGFPTTVRGLVALRDDRRQNFCVDDVAGEQHRGVDHLPKLPHVSGPFARREQS